MLPEASHHAPYKSKTLSAYGYNSCAWMACGFGTGCPVRCAPEHRGCDCRMHIASGGHAMAARANAHAIAGELRPLLGHLIRRLREQAQPRDLTWSQLAVLKRLEGEGPATVTTLARAAAVRPQSMGATVAALEAAGLVVGTPHPSDGRQTLLSLTAACREWIAAGRAAREDWLFHAIRTKLAPAEQDELAAAVALLARLVEPYATAPDRTRRSTP